MTNNSYDPAAAALDEVVATDYITPKCDSTTANIKLPAPSEERRAQSLDEQAIDIHNTKSSPIDQLQHFDTVLYLAYGSNLSAKTFKGVRGIKPIAQINIVAPEIVLTFDLPGYAYVEPCFANVRFRKESISGSKTQPLLRREAREAHWDKGLVGVVYEVTREDYATIIKTEGGGASYQDVVVECFPISNSKIVPETPETKSFKAHTLYSPGDEPVYPTKTTWQSTSTRHRYHRPTPDHAQASVRYMKLLTDGAEEHDLPEEYKQYLDAVKAFRITQNRQKVGRFFFLLVWRPIFVAIFAMTKVFADKSGRIPSWLAFLMGIMFQSCWWSYDNFFKGTFGDGERTIEKEDRIVSGQLDPEKGSSWTWHT
jgi:hypothetical protein